MRNRYKLLQITVFLLIVISLFFAESVRADQHGQWSQPMPIPYYDDPRPPFLIADHHGTVHAFNGWRGRDTNLAIYYRQWSLDQGWGIPVDIILPNTNVSRPLLDVYLDENGFFHLIYFSGTEVDRGNISYTTAWIGEAGKATGWSEPKIIAEGAGPLVCANMLSPGSDRLVIFYCGQDNGVGLYMLQSEDGGNTWSSTTLISRVNGTARWPYSVRSVVDEYSNINVVWSVVNELATGEEILYTKVHMDNLDFSGPTQLARLEPGEYSTNWPFIYAHEDEIFVIYMDGSPPTRFMRKSQDGGQTWSSPVRPFPHIGEYEHAVMLEDGSGQLHLVLGNRLTGDPDIHGMWHSIWSGVSWAPLQPIIIGPRTNTFDPSAPHAVISQGNVVLVAWRNDVRNPDTAWYSYTEVNVPQQPAVPLPLHLTPIPNETPIEQQVTVVPSATIEPVNNLFEESTNQSSNINNPGTSIIMGVLPAILIVVAVLLIKRSFYRS